MWCRWEVLLAWSWQGTPKPNGGGVLRSKLRGIAIMATVEVQKEDVLVAYADEQYRMLQIEKNQYISLDEYCAKRGI
ncbi:MAG: hypothetical protein WBN94_00165 [Methanothrix sp.]